jgi:hypothetical protein
MVAALLLLLVMVGVGVVFNPNSKELYWFSQASTPLAWRAVRCKGSTAEMAVVA